ncbi:heparan-alpha-glucosaminide N-acetyltransferase domain-containing protein [Arthrobacter gallicola]|uniref:heparan-alpha-glucosaminide N-acetyltransferase domain-containing protein n=1 Tax=Arthrobacter gallicola TaxID=2762225 RepID=UPI00296ABF3A|nr:heparan-alpha-glucosaminide N-acetyltransferase domain-containing protein [Arthrobacter gallicola]
MDAARGLALLAMMAIHILPSVNDELEPTWAWSLFAGRGVALFALLAGLSLALSSGGVRRLNGPAMTATRAGIAVRAGIIAVIGLLLGYLDIEAQVILAYYGVMFLLALPLLRLSARALMCLAGLTALLMPFLMQGLRDYLPDPGVDQPTISGLVTHFDVTAAQLLLTGVYPALPWMAFICAGLAIGRLDLRSRRVQTGLFAGGCGLALLTTLVSAFLLGPGGGRKSLEALYGDPVMVSDTLTWGPGTTLPTDSWWWLAGLAPYSSTPLVILNTIGISVAVLAALLLLGQWARPVFFPLAAMGSMTLTLYTAHLLLLATGLLADAPEISMLVQVGLFTAFALVWARKRGQGPLEHLVSSAVNRTRKTVLARAGSAPATDRAGTQATNRAGAPATDRAGRAKHSTGTRTPEPGQHRTGDGDPDPPLPGP